MRTLKIGVIMDPVEKINIDKDTTFVLILEAQQRGHEIYYMELEDLFVRGGTPYGRSRRLHVARANPHYELSDAAAGTLTGDSAGRAQAPARWAYAGSTATRIGIRWWRLRNSWRVSGGMFGPEPAQPSPLRPLRPSQSSP